MAESWPASQQRPDGDSSTTRSYNTPTSSSRAPTEQNHNSVERDDGPPIISMPSPPGDIGKHAARKEVGRKYIPGVYTDVASNTFAPGPARNQRQLPQPATETQMSDFDKKYPPDAYGEEMADTARVWKVYRDEATEHDKALMDGWNRTLDILLIFAGLFSAVATAFIIESYRQLQPDWGEVTARLLLAVVATQGGSGNFTLPANLSLQSLQQFHPPAIARWINGLWLCSLALSLAVALMSILAKQWLVRYESRIFAPARSTRDWAHCRVFYSRGLEKWHFSALIDALPVLLHVSLFLFSVGLTVFFFPLDEGIACFLIIISGALAALYSMAPLLTYWCLDCPFYIPMFRNAHSALDCALRYTGSRSRTTPRADALQAGQYAFDAAVLAWLAVSSTVEDVNAVGVFAMGAIRYSSEIFEHMLAYNVGFWKALEAKVSSLYEASYALLVSDLERQNETELSPSTCDHFRLCHAITGLTMVNGPDPRAFYIEWQRDDDYKNTLLYTLNNHAFKFSSRLVPWTIPLHLDVRLITRRWSPEDFTVMHYTLDQELHGLYIWLALLAEWSHSPVHISQTLELLSTSAVGDADLAMSIALRLIHRTVMNGYVRSIFREHFSLLATLCSRKAVSVIPPCSEHDDTLRTLLHALDLYSHILVHKADYRLDDSVVSLASSDLVGILGLMRPFISFTSLSPDARDIGWQLLLLLESPMSSEVAWDSVMDVLLGVLDILTFQLVEPEPSGSRLIIEGRAAGRQPPVLSGEALVNLTRALTVWSHPTNYHTGIFCDVLSKQPTVSFQLLVLRDGATAWGQLCESFSSDTAVDARSLPRRLVQIADILARELYAKPETVGREQLSDALFAFDFISPTLRGIPDSEVEDLDSCLACLRRLIDRISVLAPHRWPMVRDAIRAMDTAWMQDPGILRTVDEADKRLHFTALPLAQGAWDGQSTPSPEPIAMA